jgi:hypothetical protein
VALLKRIHDGPVKNGTHKKVKRNWDRLETAQKKEIGVHLRYKERMQMPGKRSGYVCGRLLLPPSCKPDQQYRYDGTADHVDTPWALLPTGIPPASGSLQLLRPASSRKYYYFKIIHFLQRKNKQKSSRAAVIADAINECMQPRRFKAVWHFKVGYMYLFQAKHLVAPFTIKMHMVVGMLPVGTGTFADCKSRNPVLIYYFMNNACVLKVI